MTMKVYNDYMNKITVSSTLHQKLVSCADSTSPKGWPIMFKRYTAVFACFAVVLLGIFTISKLTRHNVMPTPGDSPPVLQSGSSISEPDESSKYTLYFNKADSLATAKIYIPGHFWRELTDEELKAVLPTLTNTYSITATANFQSDESGTSLLNIDAHVVSAAGLKTYIQLAPGEVVLDYMFDVETKVSDVLGTPVTAGYFESESNSTRPKNIIYFATFKLSGVSYYMELGGTEVEKEALKNEISELIGILIKAGSADLNIFHPVAPELREDRLNLDEARTDVDFGAYLPAEVPAGFVFEDALRFINQEQDTLMVNWSKGMNYIDWHISSLNDNDKTRITSVGNKKNYDLSLYPIPRADSVPDELREVVDNPIFLIDELTLDVVQARTYEITDAGDEPGQRMRFGVLYEDILVELSVKGVSSEVMFDILQHIGQGTGQGTVLCPIHDRTQNRPLSRAPVPPLSYESNFFNRSGQIIFTVAI
jgi:hypothetical protein